MNLLLLGILLAAVMLFSGYILWIHNNLDTEGPVLSVPQELLEISVYDSEDALLRGVTAIDDRDGDVTSSILVESVYGISDDNLTTVTYAAFDKAGNVSKLQRTVRYIDYRGPRFELRGSLTFDEGSGFDLLDWVGAQDVLDGDIRRRIHATLVSDTKRIDLQGRHLVNLQVTNRLGDTAEITIPVTVSDSEWYTADVTLSQYMLYLEQGADFEPRSYLRGFNIRGESVELNGSIPEDIQVKISNAVNTQVPGVYEVSYELTMYQNMESFSGIAKLIVIVE